MISLTNNTNHPPHPRFELYSPYWQHFVRRIRSSIAYPLSSSDVGNFRKERVPSTFYDMPRGPNIILTAANLERLRTIDPAHPQIRRHEAAGLASQYFLLDFRPCRSDRYTANRAPHALTILCQHYNDHFLIRPTDLKLPIISLWRIIYRQSLRLISLSKSNIISHDAIYVQERYPTPDEKKCGYTKRRKSKCRRQIGIDFRTIRTNTTIATPDSINVLYFGKNFHARSHGSSSLDQQVSIGHIFDLLQIDHVEICPASAGPDGYQSINDIHVAYPRNIILRKLDKQIVRGLSSLHSQLTTQMLLGHKTDKSRFYGSVDMNESSDNLRITFGFGRVQKRSLLKKKWKVQPWTFNNHDMPTLSINQFTILPKQLQEQLVQVFEAAQSFVESHYHNPFPNELRTKQCSKRLNIAMGYPYGRFKFEYFDIVLSRNTILPKHIDSKNDHREGYNICAVYSFYQVIEGLEYRVSIIMTTRTTLGAAMKKATSLN